MNYVTGNTIKRLREKKGITQKQLADMLAVSDKTVSKWETGKGLPDIGIIKELAEALQVSIAELLTGDVVKNENTSGNMKKMSFLRVPHLRECDTVGWRRRFLLLRDHASQA